ncbi:hypothetical protein VOLCADRAFT_98410 [Volvox carteri f. nagariensis]|uniref:Uncharacterized protein n=1 Tax=Volvox carteri f. nagariensis TaxID=3068 RepID=D8UF98_VOLCA|nr:uncharacterized protein VOLCADRAFT_98410 [Volvox carteri f. nagariensis]EFJ41540.1 hypothetical protein VOLCADRAFT_98410 [Volvox carteri f. nagariensis]|eukprot:XP_002957331.1 hypothetical protein VOLCADRAFT_98410 [Volvox carteri f. nagariensis]
MPNSPFQSDTALSLVGGHSSAFVEGLPPSVKQHVQKMLPDLIHTLLPTLLPGGVAAALPAAAAALSASAPSLSLSSSARASLEARLPTILEAALVQGLATTLPKAVMATLNLLFKGSFVSAADGGDSNFSAAINSGERQQSMSLEQQNAAEAQLVRMLFGADGAEAPPPPQDRQRAKTTAAITPCVLDIAAAIASSDNSPASSPASRAGSPAATSCANSLTDQPLGLRPPSADADAAAELHAAHAAVAPAAAARRPSLATLTTAAGAPFNTSAGDIYSRRLSDTNPGSSIGSGAPVATATNTGRPPHLPIPVKASSAGVAAASVHSSQHQPCYKSSGGSGAHLGHGEDGVSSVDDALSTCSGGDMPSPYSDLCGAVSASAAMNSGTNSFLVAGGSCVDMSGADGTSLYGISGDALLDRLKQIQQSQQHCASSLGHMASPSELLMAAAGAGTSCCGRAVRPEDFLTFGAAGGAGLQLPVPTGAGLGSQAAAVQLAAAAAVAAAGGGAAATSTDLASYMDSALRRMLLVSPQVAAELARACGAFSGAHAQLHHLCCIIAEQLLDVAAMAPEVAAALLRALAAHRARGAQATDVDPRVMGRILQLLRAGPAGRQLCLVSLEQWVDGLSRIHKRRAYLDTILHNYQLTLKRLVQAMGHQVHAVNMSLPRQLLNDLSPRALLLLTAELAPYPLLQPRRWSEEIIWTITQMHAMGIDMPAGGVATNGAAQASVPTSAFQWEIRRALAATADDIAAAGGAAVACGQSPPNGGPAGPLAGLAGLSLSGGAACASQAAAGSSGATTPGGTAVPWAAHAALHRHLLLGLRRVQSRFFSDRLRKLHGLYGEPVEALLRSSLPQDVLVPERESVVLVAVLLMLECRMRPEDFDAAFGRDLQRCLAVSSAEDVAARLRCGLVPDSALRLDPHKSRALSQLLKLGTTLPGQPQF